MQATKDAEESLPGLEKGLEKSIKQLGKEEEVLESLQEKIRGLLAGWWILPTPSPKIQRLPLYASRDHDHDLSSKVYETAPSG